MGGVEVGIILFCALGVLGRWDRELGDMDDLEGWGGSMESKRFYYLAGMFTDCLILGLQPGTNHLEEGK